jgi:hypothetical protein
LKEANFTIRVTRRNPHREGTITWRVGELVTAMAGCDIHSILAAIEALERDTTEKGVGNPARWLTHFAGLESQSSGKHMEPWIEIAIDGMKVPSTAHFRQLLEGQRPDLKVNPSSMVDPSSLVGDPARRASFRESLATHFHGLVQISRTEIFGVDNEKYMPLHLPDDAGTMFAGYVGQEYKPASGILVLAINPGGGGDSYTSRPPEDERFYPHLMEFKRGPATAALKGFERINQAFASIVRDWNMWRILEPTIDAAGCSIEEVAYMNVVPYRTRENKMPPVSARRKAWDLVVGPTLDVLEPRAILTLGKKAGSVVETLYMGNLRHYCIPRTIGDSWVSDDAVKMHRIMREELAGGP